MRNLVVDVPGLALNTTFALDNSLKLHVAVRLAHRLLKEDVPIDSLSAIPPSAANSLSEHNSGSDMSLGTQTGFEFPFESTRLRGMKIHVISRKQTVDYLIDCSVNDLGGWVVTPNLDILRRYTKSGSFRNLVATSTLNVADGVPLVWASRVKGQPLPGRVNGTDLMIDVCEAASLNDKSVFFLGGNEGAADSAAAILQNDFPGLKVAGCYCPEFGFETSIYEIEQIAKILAETEPDFVFVGLGSPKQDVLINMLRLQLPQVWWLGVGISFSFIAGELPRAPDWAKTSGFEWLYRLCSEPRRLFRRYLLTGVPFLLSTLLVSAFERAFDSRSE